MIAEQHRIAATEIRTSDRRYQITDPRSIDSLAASIREAGLINPPIVEARRNGYIVVAGFGRVSACIHLGWPDIPCRVVYEETDPLVPLKIAIADNALTREFTLSEQCRAVAKLAQFCGEAQSLSELVSQLGLLIAPQLADKLLRLARMPEAVQDAAGQGCISLNAAMSLESVDHDSAESLARLFCDLRPTVNQQQEIVSGLYDLSFIEKITVSELLCESDFADILCLSEPDRRRRLQLFRDAIRRRRYPALSRATDAFYRNKRNLKMEAGMDLKPPANFEDTIYTIVLRFSSARQLSRQAECLGRICEQPELQAILNREIENPQDLY